MSQTVLKASLIGVAISLLAGCAGTVRQRNESTFAELNAVIKSRQEQSTQAVLDAEARALAAQEVNVPFVTGASVPLARETRMPEALRRSVPVTAMFASAAIDLPTALRQLSVASGISLEATPDALMAPSMFVMKTGVTSTGAAPSVSAPPTVHVRASGTPLWRVLDDVAAQVQCSWRPTATGAEFYRVETRTYELNTNSQSAATQSSLGRAGGGNSAFNSEGKTGFEMKASDQNNGIKNAVEALLTSGGKFTLTPENQTLFVTDTPAAHERVAAFVKKQNKAMARRVNMVVEQIEVVSKDGADFGVDWTVVYNTTANALNGLSPASLVGAQAAGVNLQQMIGQNTGTNLVVKALNEVGKVVKRSVFPLKTTSGRPATQALRTTFNYVDQVQATALATTNASPQAPTVTQKDETVGTFLTLVPTAKTDGTVFLTMSIDKTTADPLRPYTVGAGASAVTVQQKTINGSGSVQEVPLRAGRTEVIGGFEILDAQNTQRRLAENISILAGGSDSSSVAKSVTVLLVTAVVEEGF